MGNMNASVIDPYVYTSETFNRLFRECLYVSFLLYVSNYCIPFGLLCYHIKLTTISCTHHNVTTFTSQCIRQLLP